MGKSPAKWIKAVLFGKKLSKSNISKEATIERIADIATKAISGDLVVNPSLNSDPSPRMVSRSGEISESEQGITVDLPCEGGLILSRERDAESIAITRLNSVTDAEIMRQRQAAVKVQAVFRGYLARRAFCALKGIIRLQALVRGHLVRRQAVATLHSMQAIIKLQALVRGRSVRLSAAGCEVFKKYRTRELMDVKRAELYGVNTPIRSERLATNAFVTKLLASSPTAMPLSLQYDPSSTNSAYNWLERWSSTCFWVPLTRPKKVYDAKLQRKQANMHIEETEVARPKRGVRKFPITSGGDNNLLPSLENEKFKRNVKRPSANIPESMQEQPQTELERVKRNLKKVSVSATGGSDRSEAVVEKAQHDMIKLSNSLPPDVSQGLDNTSEKIDESTVNVYKQLVADAPPPPLVEDEPLHLLEDDQPSVEQNSSEFSAKVEDTPRVDENLSLNDDQVCKEDQITRTRKSFHSKQEFPENISQNTPAMPSYMAATESAKAKVRAQGSPRLAEDGTENVLIRRHSLPSSTNSKLSALSPRIQKPILANGKGGSKNNRSLTSSRDDKVLQPGWRR